MEQPPCGFFTAADDHAVVFAPGTLLSGPADRTALPRPAGLGFYADVDSEAFDCVLVVDNV